MARRILVGLDMSSGSFRALEAASALAVELNAELDVVHAWEPPSPPPVLANESANLMTTGPDPYRAIYDPAAEIAAVRESVERLVADRGVKVGRIYVEAGHPARTIIDTAQRGGHEIIVVGTHGHGGFVRMLLGSVAEQVVRHAGRPVLTIPPADSERRARSATSPTVRA